MNTEAHSGHSLSICNDANDVTVADQIECFASSRLALSSSLISRNRETIYNPPLPMLIRRLFWLHIVALIALVNFCNQTGFFFYIVYYVGWHLSTNFGLDGKNFRRKLNLENKYLFISRFENFPAKFGLIFPWFLKLIEFWIFRGRSKI